MTDLWECPDGIWRTHDEAAIAILGASGMWPRNRRTPRYRRLGKRITRAQWCCINPRPKASGPPSAGRGR
jgi:hypothetical protein